MIDAIASFFKVLAPIFGWIDNWVAKYAAKKKKVQGEVLNYEADATTSADTKIAVDEMDASLDKAYNDKFATKPSEPKP